VRSLGVKEKPPQHEERGHGAGGGGVVGEGAGEEALVFIVAERPDRHLQKSRRGGEGWGREEA